MIELFSLEFWIAVGFVINFLFVILLMGFARRINRLSRKIELREIGKDETGVQDSDNKSARAVKDIIHMLEPLMIDSQKVAVSFDEQIREKKRLVKELNDALDSRIISINLLLSRADTLQRKIDSKNEILERYSSFPNFSESSRLGNNSVIDQQNSIIELYHQGSDADTIASKLNLPKGEVQLVIDLKKKFLAMEIDR